MKRGDICTIKIDDRPRQVSYLGAGAHAKAYRDGDAVFLLVHDEDEHMKEAVEMWCSPMPHIPDIKRHDAQTGRGGKEIQVYSMPFYPNITASDREAWAVLKTLTEAAERIRRARYGYRCERNLYQWGLYFARDVIDDTRGKVPETVSEALTELMNAGSNYGSGVTFEFGRRNIGTDGQGRIVFRDILFDAEKVQREQMAEMRARRWW